MRVWPASEAHSTISLAGSGEREDHKFQELKIGIVEITWPTPCINLISRDFDSQALPLSACNIERLGMGLGTRLCTVKSGVVARSVYTQSTQLEATQVLTLRTCGHVAVITLLQLSKPLEVACLA